MRATTLLNCVLCLPKTTVRDVEFGDVVTVWVRPQQRVMPCPHCDFRTRHRYGAQNRRRGIVFEKRAVSVVWYSFSVSPNTLSVMIWKHQFHPTAAMITAQVGPKFVQTTGRTGAKSGDHTHSTALYSPQDGELAGPNGMKYTIDDSGKTGDNGWKDMLAPAG